MGPSKKNPSGERAKALLKEKYDDFESKVEMDTT